MEPPPKKPKMSATESDGEDPAAPSAGAEPDRPRYKRRKVAIFLAYCGAGYQGMQKNPGARTIEAELEEALFLAGAIPEEERGISKRYDWARSARTDKGVSAAGQVVSGRFYVDPPGLVDRLNAHLPPQIRVFGYKRVINSFSSKKLCDRRRYVYLLPVFAVDPAAHPHREAVMASLGSENELEKCVECSERGRKVVGAVGRRYGGGEAKSSGEGEGIGSNLQSGSGGVVKIGSGFDGYVAEMVEEVNGQNNSEEKAKISEFRQLSSCVVEKCESGLGGNGGKMMEKMEEFMENCQNLERQQLECHLEEKTECRLDVDGEELVEKVEDLDGELNSMKRNVEEENGRNWQLGSCGEAKVVSVLVANGEKMVENVNEFGNEAEIEGLHENNDKSEPGLAACKEENTVEPKDLEEKDNGERTPFNYGEAEKERFNRILGHFVGTHNFHNFTTRTKAEDPSANRYILSFNADSTLNVQGMDFIRCEVVGQSFMLHQIRKMIGLAVAVMRNCAPESLIPTALSRNVRINVPTAPEVGLYLDESLFSSYNKKWKYSHEEVSMETYKEEAERFKMQYIFCHIASTEKQEGVVGLWLHSLNHRNYPDLRGIEVHSVSAGETSGNVDENNIAKEVV